MIKKNNYVDEEVRIKKSVKSFKDVFVYGTNFVINFLIKINVDYWILCVKRKPKCPRLVIWEWRTL